jgi:tRNA pseudouridine38-40 synthase
VKLAFTTEYDGSAFSGFQRQKNADSVQQNIEEALEKITQNKVVINYAGRTDSGVHALSQVFDFETDLERPDKNWIDGINSNLVDSIAVSSISRVPNDFHSRFSAIERSYTYVIYNSRSKPLFFGNMSHRDNNKIDLDVLQQQSKMFLGSHDFTSFRSSSCNSKNPVKKVNMIDIESHDRFIFVTIKANAFLHNMVRIMVGTLLDIAKGEIDYSIEEILTKKDRSFAGKTLSAKGLFFLGPKYNSEFNIASPTNHLMDRFKI